MNTSVKAVVMMLAMATACAAHARADDEFFDLIVAVAIGSNTESDTWFNDYREGNQSQYRKMHSENRYNACVQAGFKGDFFKHRGLTCYFAKINPERGVPRIYADKPETVVAVLKHAAERLSAEAKKHMPDKPDYRLRKDV